MVLFVSGSTLFVKFIFYPKLLNNIKSRKNFYPSLFQFAHALSDVKALQSLRGPRGGMIFFKKELVLGVDLEQAINNAVFPGLQVSCAVMLFHFQM